MGKGMGLMSMVLAVQALAEARDGRRRPPTNACPSSAAVKPAPRCPACASHLPGYHASIMIVIVMGVTRLWQDRPSAWRLAERLGWHFFDADQFHPPENIAKMSRGSR